MQRYTQLAVWSEAHAIAILVYRATESFPRREWYGLGSQLRRAAISVPTNIAEGSKRASDRDFAHFVNIAEASAAETEYLVVFCTKVGLMNSDSAAEILARLEILFRKLVALRRRLRG